MRHRIVLHRIMAIFVMLALSAGMLSGCGGTEATPGTGSSGTGEATATTATGAAGGAATPTTAAATGETPTTATSAGGAETPTTGAAAGQTPTEAAATTPGTAGGGTTADLTTGISDKFKGTTLNVVFANHAWNTAITKYIPQFEQASGIKLNVSSFGEDQLSQQLTVRFTSGGGNIDMMMFRPLQEGKLFANNGWLSEDTSLVQGASDWDWNDFQAPAKGTVTFDSKVYGVPIVTEREILYYRKDLLEAKGISVPKTLDELTAAAEKLNDPNGGVYGFVARGQRAPAVTQFSSFLYSMGGDWAKDGQAAVDSPEAIKAYQLYGDILRKWGAPGVLNMSWPQAIGIFGQGKAAMYTDADSLYPNLLDKTKSVVADKVGYAQFPAGPAGSKPYNVTSWALGISEASKNKDAAWEFIKWATSKNVVMALQQGGLPGARTSVWASPEGITGFPPDLAKVITESAKVGVDHDRPLVVNVGQARDIVGAPIVASIQGQDVAAAAKSAATQFTDFLKTDTVKK